jgi:hypothetical protein
VNNRAIRQYRKSIREELQIQKQQHDGDRNVKLHVRANATTRAVKLIPPSRPKEKGLLCE